MADSPARLDEQMRPERVGWVGGQSEPVGDRDAGQRQVARGWCGCGAELPAEGIDGQRRYPLRQVVVEVGRGEQPRSDSHQPLAECAAVPGLAPVRGDLGQSLRLPRSPTQVPGSGRKRADELLAALDAGDTRQGLGQ